jgi:RimK family alpha-L-glutamate ligase
MDIAILGGGQGWHFAELSRALGERGHRARVLRISALTAHLGHRPQLGSDGVPLAEADGVLTRSIPSGSLEQVIFRVDALHWLERLGTPVVNPAATIERTVDKFYTSALLQEAGLPTPRTVVAERLDDALGAFRQMRDVIVKPLFGSGGHGMVRVSDEEIAYRVFRALDLERAVFYLQEALPHPGRDIRAFVVGQRVVAAAWRCAEGWRTNVAQGGRVERATLPRAWEELSVRAARAVAADYAGVDLLPLADGRVFILEVNGIPAWQGLQTVAEVDVAGAIVEHLETVARSGRSSAQRAVL